MAYNIQIRKKDAEIRNFLSLIVAFVAIYSCRHLFSQSGVF